MDVIRGSSLIGTGYENSIFGGGYTYFFFFLGYTPCLRRAGTTTNTIPPHVPILSSERTKMLFGGRCQEIQSGREGNILQI